MTKNILYLGLTPPKEIENNLIHFPVIKIHPRPLTDKALMRAFEIIPDLTHLVFTSKTTVKIFFDSIQKLSISLSAINPIKIAVVGKSTAGEVEKQGCSVWKTALEETSEGLVKVLKNEIVPQDYILWPHSVLSRDILSTFLASTGCSFYECIFYDTEIILPGPPPTLDTIDEIIFTSPSTVDGFLQAYGELPLNKKLTCQGPVTESYLNLRNTRPSDTMHYTEGASKFVFDKEKPPANPLS